MNAPVPLPRSLVWEVTARCNHACVHCYNVWTAQGACPPRELTAHELERVVRALAPLGRRLRALTLSGGEPLLRDDLAELLGLLRRAFPRAQLAVATNGALLSRERAAELRKAGVTVVQVTLLSARPEVHEAMTGAPGSFLRVMDAIVAAKEAGLVVAVFFVATARNIADWPGAARLALSLGADALTFNRFQPGGRNLEHWRALTPSPAALAGALREFPSLRKLADVNLGTLIPPCEATPVPAGPTSRLRTWLFGAAQAFTCPIGTRNAYPAVGPDGSLRPCNHLPDVAGNLLEADIEALLPSPCMQPPNETFGECAACGMLASCRGGCPAARRLAGEPIYAIRQTPEVGAACVGGLPT